MVNRSITYNILNYLPSSIWCLVTKVKPESIFMALLCLLWQFLTWTSWLPSGLCSKFALWDGERPLKAIIIQIKCNNKKCDVNQLMPCCYSSTGCKRETILLHKSTCLFFCEMAVCSRVPVFYAAWILQSYAAWAYIPYLHTVYSVHLLVYDMYLVGRAAVLYMFKCIAPAHS